MGPYSSINDHFLHDMTPCEPQHLQAEDHFQRGSAHAARFDRLQSNDPGISPDRTFPAGPDEIGSV